MTALDDIMTLNLWICCHSFFDVFCEYGPAICACLIKRWETKAVSGASQSSCLRDFTTGAGWSGVFRSDPFPDGIGTRKVKRQACIESGCLEDFKHGPVRFDYPKFTLSFKEGFRDLQNSPETCAADVIQVQKIEQNVAMLPDYGAVEEIAKLLCFIGMNLPGNGDDENLADLHAVDHDAHG